MTSVTRRNRTCNAFAAFVFAAVVFSGGQALASGAEAFVQKAAERTFGSLGKSEISDKELARRFRVILQDTFDLPKIARFTLGRYWPRASEAQRAEYVKLFGEFLVLAYANRFRDLTGKKLRINKVRELNDKESVVSSEILTANEPPVPVNWRIRNKSGAYKITDVAVRGVSMSVTQRDEFAAVIRSSGGGVDGLLRALRKKTGK